MNRSILSILFTLIIAGSIPPDAFAQPERILECGARIVSNQPFNSNTGDRICLFATDVRDQARVVLRGCTAETADLHSLWRITLRDGGGVYITTALEGRQQRDRRMEVADFNKDDGATIQIWGPNIGNGYRSQTWNFFPINNPLRNASGFLLISVDSGKCLNVPLGRNPLDQEVAQTFTCAGAPNDTWRVEPMLPMQDCD